MNSYQARIMLRRTGNRSLAQLVGRETAAELLFTGDIIDANRALKSGSCRALCHTNS